MRDRLYRWPAAARFGRTVPKTKFYEHASIGSTIKDRFVSDVRRITWAYKLAESTINLPGSVEIPEIQVFEIGAKEEDVAEGVLAAIDKAVRTPIIFEISRGEGENGTIRMAAAHKQLGAGIPKLGPYFSTEWQPVSGERVPLPTAIALMGLYTALLQPLTSVAPRAGESVSDVVDRLTTVRSLEREIAALERKMRNEPQLNRKVELRRALKSKQAALTDLMGATDSPATGNTN
ncbi:DUF4391 domain-containing protein [Blastococcus sp. TML/M2B]|uniref:DUF4391 domain-containing protein n=1 Tax=unclassified Blastococcus TaxID=2619396 RepID=UPI00190D8C49|nr:MULTISPECIES: DUF4391 domain-containing protein [unclassified Blastococcus]MBN1093337.1 DUF4391 domain-containing protein [Blastococcus sp. TML/M2B]MBN1096548.1 DUF4391 domain-containing protein [Blastococcus sp. TML/C7B]